MLACDAVKDDVCGPGVQACIARDCRLDAPGLSVGAYPTDEGARHLARPILHGLATVGMAGHALAVAAEAGGWAGGWARGMMRRTARPARPSGRAGAAGRTAAARPLAAGGGALVRVARAAECAVLAPGRAEVQQPG